MMQGLMDSSDTFSSSTFPFTSTSTFPGTATPTSTPTFTPSPTSFKTFPTGGPFASTAEGSTIRPYFGYSLQDPTMMRLSQRTTSNSSGSGKRARSPESCGERPSKRPSLAHNAQRPVVGGGLGFRRLSAGVSSAGSSRHPSEDWVQQAGGLSIDSPIFAAQSAFPLVPASDGDFDMEMAVEEEEQDVPSGSMSMGMGMIMGGGPVSQLAPLQTTAFVQDIQQSQQQQQQPATPHRHHYSTRYAERLQASLGGPPQINVVPATPVNPPHHQAPHQAQHAHGQVQMHAGQSGPDPFTVTSGGQNETRPSTPPPSSPTPMSISPMISFAQLASTSMSSVTAAAGGMGPMSPGTPTATKTRRVMFGPRTGCEKCRLGIRHFTHYE